MSFMRDLSEELAYRLMFGEISLDAIRLRHLYQCDQLFDSAFASRIWEVGEPVDLGRYASLRHRACQKCPAVATFHYAMEAAEHPVEDSRRLRGGPCLRATSQAEQASKYTHL